MISIPIGYLLWPSDFFFSNRDCFALREVTTFFPEHLECAVRVKILPSGNLASIKLDKSSGNMAYDAFSEQAIYKSAPFDMPEDPKVNKELVEHELEFVFPAKLVSE